MGQVLQSARPICRLNALIDGAVAQGYAVFGTEYPSGLDGQCGVGNLMFPGQTRQGQVQQRGLILKDQTAIFANCRKIFIGDVNR